MNGEARLPIFMERLNSLLEGRSITASAKELTMSRQTLGFYLNGDRLPDIKAFRGICEHYGVSADWLLGLSEVKATDRIAAYKQGVADYRRFLIELLAGTDVIPMMK